MEARSMSKTNRITSSRPTAEGIELTFERPFSLHGGLKLNRWWFSWWEISRLGLKAILEKERKEK